MRTSRIPTLAGAALGVTILSMATAGPALAATDVVVTDRETVQAYLTPTGEVKVARVYDQVTATGQGTVELANPVGTDGLRNLDGLGDPDVRDGEVVSTIDVDGETSRRTVSSFDEDRLPVTITPTYQLDGKTYEDPEDIVGRSGTLEVTSGSRT
jgi:putative membrane protein